MFIFIDDNPVSKFFNEHLINESENKDIRAICFKEAADALNYLTPLQAVLTESIYVFIKMDMPAMNAWEFIDRCEQLECDKDYLNIVLMTKEELDVEEEIKLSKLPNVSTINSFEINNEYINEIIKKTQLKKTNAS